MRLVPDSCRLELNWPHLMREPTTCSEFSPTLVLLHGHGKFQGHLFDLLSFVDNRLRIIALRAPHRIGPGSYRWFAYSRSPDGTIYIDRVEHEESQRMLLDLVATLRDRCRAPIFIAGHSQGGMIALCAALARPDLFRGCAVLNGRLLNEVVSRKLSMQKQAISFFIAHGINDEIIPVERGRSIRDYLMGQGVRPVYREYNAEHEPTQEMFTDFSYWIGDQLDCMLGSRQGSTPAAPHIGEVSR